MGKTRYITALTLAVFLLNALLPFLADYSTGSTRKVAMCTLEGLELVDVGTDAPIQHPEYECALCVLTAYGFASVTPVAEETAIHYHPKIAMLRYRLVDEGRRSHYFLTTNSSRAPPGSVIL